MFNAFIFLANSKSYIVGVQFNSTKFADLTEKSFTLGGLLRSLKLYLQEFNTLKDWKVSLLETWYNLPRRPWWNNSFLFQTMSGGFHLVLTYNRTIFDGALVSQLAEPHAIFCINIFLIWPVQWASLGATYKKKNTSDCLGHRMCNAW